MPKEEASSAAVDNESLLLSEFIDAKENCNTITLDTLSTFAQYDMLKNIGDNQTMLKICRALVGMPFKIEIESNKDFAT